MEKWANWVLTESRNSTLTYKREIIKNGSFSERDYFYFTPEEKKHILHYSVSCDYPKKAVAENDGSGTEYDFDAPFSVIHRIITDTELNQLLSELPRNNDTQPVTVEDLELDPLGFYIKDGVLLEFEGKFTDPFILPDVSEIGYKAFEANIHSRSRFVFPSEIVLPKSLKKINELAFANCDRLQKIIIPDSVEYMGEGAFSGCKLTEGVTLPKGIDRIEACVFKNTQLNSITIPEGVKSIGNEAFMNCYSLKSIDIPDSVEEIGELAFARCRSLKNINGSSEIKKLINDMRK